MEQAGLVAQPPSRRHTFFGRPAVLSCRMRCRYMFSLLQHAQAFRQPRLLLQITSHSRPRSTLTKQFLQATTPAAEQLLATNVWNEDGRAVHRSAKRRGDKSRVNIVDSRLCDDVISYIGPSLQRHVGCDLIDINPGAGLWSHALHEALEPRSHILMEPDFDLYASTLDRLVGRPGVHVLKKSGILWNELNEALQLLPRQVMSATPYSQVPLRNDTLLVTANLSYYPMKRYGNFSVAQLVMYQLISSIRLGSLFQKYGLVRMLIWTNNENKRAVLPQSVNTRRKSALEAELSCDSITEVAGMDNFNDEAVSSNWSSRRAPRDHWMDVQSAAATIQRMQRAGVCMPVGREGYLFTEAKELLHRGNDFTNSPVDEPDLSRPYQQELAKLEQAYRGGGVTRDSALDSRLRLLRATIGTKKRHASICHGLITEQEEITSLRVGGGLAESDLHSREEAWNAKVHALTKNLRIGFRLLRDNLHLFRQRPPVLQWDRREIDPLIVRAVEFLPNTECSLLDIQPKAMHPLLRATESGNTFELIVRSMLGNSVDPITRQLDNVWPGASEGVIPCCPSLRDPSRGGMVGSGYGELSSRVLNEEQWMEILEAWTKWPFRPTYPQLVGRHTDDLDVVESGLEGISNSSMV